MTPLTDTADLILAMARALASDAALDAWCRSEFSRPATIWVDINDQDPPETEDYPVIAILGVTGDDRGAPKREITRQIHIGCAVENGTLETDGAQKIHRGFLQAERLRELAEAAIYRARLGGTATEGISASESRPPVFTSFSVITITTLRTTRRGQPE